MTFNNMHYDLPAWSISILPDCRNVVFNTAKVSKDKGAHIAVSFFFLSFFGNSNWQLRFSVPYSSESLSLKLLMQLSSCHQGGSSNFTGADDPNK